MTSGSGNGRSAAGARLARGHAVSLGSQLAAGLEAAIRDGHLPPGARLPSTRDLARRLGVHRSTVNAAYARLRRRGCVQGRERGRLAVTDGPAWPAGRGSTPFHAAVMPLGGREPATADAPASRRDATETRPGRHEPESPALASALVSACVSAALRRAVTAGVPRREVVSALARTVADLGAPAPSDRTAPLDDRPRAREAPVGDRRPPARLVLFEPRPGLRLALAAELERRLRVGVVAVRSLPEAGRRGPVLVRPEVLARLDEDRGRRGPVGSGLELLPLPLAGGTRERGLVRRSVRGGVVALVSVSASVRRYAGELAAREFERGVSFTAVDPRDRAAVIRAVGIARLVLYDDASRDALPGTSVPSAAVRLVPPGPIAALRGYLGVDPDPHDPRRGT